MYADDVLIYCSNKDVNVLNSDLQESVDKIKEWYDSNLLVVNASKSNVMMVTTRQRETVMFANAGECSPINVSMGDKVLGYVED